MSVSTYSAQDLANFVNQDGSSKAIEIANKSEEIININNALSTDVLTGEYEVFIPDGQVTVGHWEGSPTTPAVSETAIQTVSHTGTAINPYNSNSTEIVRGSVKQVYNTYVDNGQVKISSQPKTGSFATNAAYLLGEVNAATTAVSVGTSLGKIIGNGLYEANPDFWSKIDIEQMDATWWDRIISDNPYNTYLMNAIFGIDVNGNAQAYVNEDAYAYLAQYMKEQGAFNDPIINRVEPSTNFMNPFYSSTMMLNSHVYKSSTGGTIGSKNFLTDGDGRGHALGISNFAGPVSYCIYYIQRSGQDSWGIIYASSDPDFRPAYDLTINVSTNTVISTGSFGSRQSYVKDGKTVYYYMSGITSHNVSTPDPTWVTSDIPISKCGYTGYVPDSSRGSWAWQMIYGTPTSESVTPAIDGITNQTGATLPDVSSWDTPQNTLDSLKQQYPDLWNDAITYDVPDSDGNLQPQTWVPIPWPTIAPNVNPWTYTQPTTDTDIGTQTKTKVNLRDLPETITQPLTQTLTQPVTDSDVPDVPENPTDTGSGDSPTPVLPTGKASALWSVYHPTQAQVDSFGGWLWSSDFIDQLIRVFQNPMDAVISLRKVFVTPVDAGQTTIHAGFLDSEVPSNYITQQYVYADCGYVDVQEAFGNVFDYTSTHVSLYLPFIGIVTLNTAEVMRSTLHVVYGVDMFTGTCLARVEVQRDGNTVTMYQYSGNASVEYPLSGQRASSFLGGLMAIGGAAAGVATGGGSVALAASAIGGMTQMSSVNVSHSGGFSGNAGAMGIKKPYIIIERPQTKVAKTFPRLAGYPTNYSCKLSDCTNHVVVKHVHVEGINATESELSLIRDVLMAGVIC